METKRMSRTFTYLAVMSTLCAPGCGGGGEFETAVVEGVITLDGQPVYPARITFAPSGSEGAFETGRPATGATDVDGSYRIDNVIVGSNTVAVSMQATDPLSEEEQDSEMSIPLAGEPTQESYQVDSGTNSIDIALREVSPASGRPAASQRVGFDQFDD